jgi:hypothetical protein
VKPNNRLGSVSVGKLQMMLTSRDLDILRSVREYKFLATRQIYALHFSTHASYASGIRACTRVLARLLEHKLLYRLARPIGGGGGGSMSYVWGIGAAGDRLLRADPDSQYEKRFRAYEPTPMFLAHTLAIADVRVELQGLAEAGELEVLRIVTEPSNWRSFMSRGRMLVLKPDLYVVTASEESEWHRYVEVDRGTESIQVLLKKASIYEEFKNTGDDEERLGIVPQVLWLMPNKQRVDRFEEALQGDRRLDERLHRVIRMSDLREEFLDGDALGDQLDVEAPAE